MSCHLAVLYCAMSVLLGGFELGSGWWALVGWMGRGYVHERGGDSDREVFGGVGGGLKGTGVDC